MNKTFAVVSIWVAVAAIGYGEPGAGVAAGIFALIATAVVCRA